MVLYDWARRHGIPYPALQELLAALGALDNHGMSPTHDGLSESAVQSALRLNASKAGWRLWRNNNGAAKLEKRYIRWGLANDSKQVNEICKSSDLIGLRPVAVRSEHVGLVIGQFVAREVKPEAWRYTGTKREVAQLNFINLVNSLGGDAKFANTGDDV